MQGPHGRWNEPMAVRARVLAHPLVIALVVAWALNDHVLKATFGGPVTGKVSDVAGLVVFPLLVGTLWPGARPWVVGTAVTVTFYTVINLSQWASDLTAAGLGVLVGPSSLTADHSDLLVLPSVLAVSVITSHPPTARWAGGVGRGVLAVGLLTTVATSRIDEGTEHVLGVEGAPNGVAVAISPLLDEDEPPTCTDVWSSADGRAWVRLENRSSCPRRPRRPATPPVPLSAQTACHADQTTCFRVGDGVVERSTDGGTAWSVVWRWPSDRGRFDWRWCPLGCAYESRGPHAVAVATLARSETVVVALGNEGVLLSSDGLTWENVAVGPTGDQTSLTGNGPLWPEHLVIITLGVLLAAMSLQIGRLPETREGPARDDPVRRRHRVWLTGWSAAVLLLAIGPGGAAFWRFSQGHIWRWSDALRLTGATLGIITLLAIGVSYLARRASLARLR
ncbi:MAG: hypothetical protein ACR2QE_14470 [Acidimicrobiales bacterium]